VLLAAAWRVWLGTRYAGWEESDYGNLAMIRGVLDGGFRHYDMNHLPLYYGVSALVMAVVGDAVIAARSVALVSGLATVGLGVALADRLYGRRVAWTVALILILQPELSLYSASSLREPLYAALLLGSLTLATREHLGGASWLAGAAFLTRMDALVAWTPALAVHALGRRDRWRRLALALVPMGLVVLAWSAYCRFDHGTWAFWGHSVSVNLETGGVEDTVPALQRVANGLVICARLLGEVLPSRIGWGIWLCALGGLVIGPLRRHDPRRTLRVAAAGLLAFWLGVGFLAQHDPSHNLYWKWLHGVIPLLVLVAVPTLWRVADKIARHLGRAASWVVVAAVLGQAVNAMVKETFRQLEESEALYRPQLDLAKWIEENVSEDKPVIVDNIPGCWLDRRSHERTLWSWMDVVEEIRDANTGMISPWTRAEFGSWLARERIHYVLWFQEEWTQAPVVAPWLVQEQVHDLGVRQLQPLRSEWRYGWVFYEVVDVQDPGTQEPLRLDDGLPRAPGESGGGSEGQ
jgi:hypothetical protein